MRVLLAPVSLDMDALERGVRSDGHDVEVLQSERVGANLASRIRGALWDVVVVEAQEELLTDDVVDACDSRGVLIVAVILDAQTEANARRLAISETVTPWQQWADVLHIATSGSDTARRSVRATVLSETHARSHIAQGNEKAQPRVITVWGPTGGPGRSTVAVNLSLSLARRGQRVVLIDADTYGGAIAIRLGVFDEAPGVARACRLASATSLSPETFDTVVHPVTVRNWQVDVVTGLSGTSRWPEISSDRLGVVLSVAQQIYDVVVVDAGFSLETDEEVSSDLLAPRRNAATLCALRAAHHIVAVSAGDAVGLSRFIRMWSELGDVAGETPVTVAVNRVVARRDLAAVGEDIASAFSRFAGIHEVVLVPLATDLFARAEARNEPPYAVDPGASFSSAIDEVARRCSPGSSTAHASLDREKRKRFRLLG